MGLRRVRAIVALLAVTWLLAASAAAPLPRAAPEAFAPGARGPEPGAAPARTHAARHCLKRSKLGKCERWSPSRHAPPSTPGRPH